MRFCPVVISNGYHIANTYYELYRKMTTFPRRLRPRDIKKLTDFVIDPRQGFFIESQRWTGPPWDDEPKEERT